MAHEDLERVRGHALIAASNLASVMFDPTPEQVIALAEMFTAWITDGVAAANLGDVRMATNTGEELTQEQLQELRDKAVQNRAARKSARKTIHE